MKQIRLEYIDVNRLKTPVRPDAASGVRYNKILRNTMNGTILPIVISDKNDVLSNFDQFAARVQTRQFNATSLVVPSEEAGDRGLIKELTATHTRLDRHYLGFIEELGNLLSLGVDRSDLRQYVASFSKMFS